MEMNRLFIVWKLVRRNKTYFYCEKFASLMTENFSEATILDPNNNRIWEMAEDSKYGEFKVHQAPEKEIFKWQLKNKVPNERL